MLPEHLFDEPRDQAVADRKEADGELEFLAAYMDDILSQRGKGAGPYTKSLNTALAELHEEYDQVLAAVYEFKFGAINEGKWLLPRNISNRTPKAVPEVMIDRYASAGRKQLWTPQSEGIETVEDWKSLVLPLYEGSMSDGETGMSPDFKRALTLPNAASPLARHVLMMFGISVTGREGPQRILDIGCSINTSLKGIALSEQADDEELEVIGIAGKKNEYVADERRTLAVKKLLNERGVQLERGVGIDIYDWQSPELSRHAWNNTFYLEELDDSELIDRFNRVVSARPDNVEFQQVDATIDHDSPLADDVISRRRKPYGPGLSRPNFDELFDVVCLRTVLYQLDERERRVALKNAHKWVKPDGMIMVQDFINFTSRSATRFIPQSRWPGNYKTWIKDMRSPELGFVNYFNTESGRAKRILFMPDIGRLALAHKYGLVPPSKA